MKKYSLIQLLLLLLLLGSCKNACRDEVQNSLIDKALNPYKFKAGTYWVYDNNVTHALDSMYLYQVDQGITFSKFQYHGAYPNCGDYMYEYYYMKIYDTIDLKAYSLSMKMGNGRGVYLSGYQSVSISPDAIYWSDYPSNLSLVVNGKTYSNVQKLEILTPSQYSYKTDIYIAPYLGIIKRVEYDTPQGTVEWNLIRYNIVQ